MGEHSANGRVHPPAKRSMPRRLALAALAAVASKRGPPGFAAAASAEP